MPGLRNSPAAPVNRDHENSLFLPGIELDRQVKATGRLAEVADADAVLLVVPAQFLRAVTTELGAVMDAMSLWRRINPTWPINAWA